MIQYTNTLKLNFAQGSDNTALNLKAKSTRAASDSDFKSVFDKAFSDNSSRKDNGNSQVRSYRDIEAARAANSNQSTVKKASGSLNTQDINNQPENTPDDTKQYDEQINILAQILGMSPAQLVKLAKDLGFSAEDLKDLKKMTLFMQKLADYLDMNDSQKETLIKLAQEVSNQTKSENNTTPLNEADSAKADVAAVSQTDDETVDIKKLSDDIKSKIDALINSGKSDPNSISSEVSKVIDLMKAQAQNRINVQTAADNTAGAETTEAVQVSADAQTASAENGSETKKTEVKDAVNAKEEKGSSTEGMASGKTENQTGVNTVAVQVNTVNDQNQQQVNTFAELKIGMANNQPAVEKPAFTMPQPVKSSEIINQVLEQAKIVLGQDKSEMVIHLKPDHLGKLELKVVTEQGIVAAKFIAENQQVKEIIETNMQLLKDSLQKQGISIDGVSVQVGHDKNGDYQQSNSYNSSGSPANKLKYGGSEEGVTGIAANVLDTLPERLAQYAYETNTINLTA